MFSAAIFMCGKKGTGRREAAQKNHKSSETVRRWRRLINRTGAEGVKGGDNGQWCEILSPVS